MSQTEVREGATASADGKATRKHRRTQSSVGTDLKDWTSSLPEVKEVSKKGHTRASSGGSYELQETLNRDITVKAIQASSDQAAFKNVIIDHLDFGSCPEKRFDHHFGLPEFIKQNYADSIKVHSSISTNPTGDNKSSLKDKYMKLFALSPIVEERMSEENHLSLNPRKRSKAGISQSNIISNIASKDHSFVKTNFNQEKDSWIPPGSILEANHLDEVKSIESGREASTKIEDVRDSITDGIRDSVPQDTRVIIKPELNIAKSGLPVRHKKAISMLDPPSDIKKSPKLLTGSTLVSQNGSKVGEGPNLKNVQIGKAISNLRMGTTDSWNQVFEKKKEKMPSSHTKNSSLGGAIPTLKLHTSPSKKVIKDDKKKVGVKAGSGTKTLESIGAAHRRTTSDLNLCPKSSHIPLNSARVGGKLLGCAKITETKPEWDKTSPTKTVGSIKSDNSNTFAKKGAPTFADGKKRIEALQASKQPSSGKKEFPQVGLEKELKGLKKENVMLKQENQCIKKILDQNSELVEKYKSLVSVIQQNMDTLKYSVDTEIIMDYLEPFESPANPTPVISKAEEAEVNKKEPSKPSVVAKKRLSGDFSGGTLSKKTHNNLSAKDLRMKVSSPSDNNSSTKDIRHLGSLNKKNEKTLSAKDVRAVKK